MFSLVALSLKKEDDAEYAENFGVELFRLLDALDQYDETWAVEKSVTLIVMVVGKPMWF